MRRLFPKLLFSAFTVLLLSGSLQAQQSRSTYDSVATFVQQAINSGNSDLVYNITNAAFHQKMSAKQFAVGMNKFRAKNGTWLSLTYQRADENGSYYLAEFDLGKQLFALNLDNGGKIVRLNFEEIPYKPSIKKYKVASNNKLITCDDKLVDSLILSYIQNDNTAGAVIALIYPNQVKRYSYGTVDKKLKKMPDAESTLFEIGSVTKTFTSLLLAQQVVKNKIALNDPINNYLPDSVPTMQFNGQSIKMVHLANHTSGFPRLPENIFNGNIDPKNPYLHYVPDSLFSYLVHYKPTVPPGSRFSYSNYGAGLLGTILENQLGMGFGQLITEKIAKPLGMHRTFVEIPTALSADFAIGYNENGKPTTAWDLASLKGSGAVRSTLNDMIIYTQAQIAGKGALKDAIALSHITTFTGPGQAMALGWRVDKLGDKTFFHHSGGTGGFRSFVGFSVTAKVGVVILSNAADDVTTIGQQLLKNF
jgi:CubicO group peptidase (beta-lactamase class C family)